MSAVYAPIEVGDALLKMQLYLGMLGSKLPAEKLEKVVILASETFLKFMESEEFSREAYERVKAVALQRNYYALLLLDQMLKNNKHAFKAAKREVEHLFKGVWEKAWAEHDNATKLDNLRLLVKVWGYIYGEKYEENLRKWLEQAFKAKLSISPEHEAELKELYGASEQPKQDARMEELIVNMEMEEKPRRERSHNESLLEALGIDQD